MHCSSSLEGTGGLVAWGSRLLGMGSMHLDRWLLGRVGLEGLGVVVVAGTWVNGGYPWHPLPLTRSSRRSMGSSRRRLGLI